MAVVCDAAQIGTVTDQLARSMLSFRSLRATAIALALTIAATLQAQITPTEYAARRDSLAARIGDGFVVAFGGRTPVSDFGTFFQLPAFHYLTG